MGDLDDLEPFGESGSLDTPLGSIPGAVVGREGLAVGPFPVGFTFVRADDYPVVGPVVELDWEVGLDQLRHIRTTIHRLAIASLILVRLSS